MGSAKGMILGTWDDWVLSGRFPSEGCILPMGRKPRDKCPNLIPLSHSELWDGPHWPNPTRSQRAELVVQTHETRAERIGGDLERKMEAGFIHIWQVLSEYVGVSRWNHAICRCSYNTPLKMLGKLWSRCCWSFSTGDVCWLSYVRIVPLQMMTWIWIPVLFF